MDDSHLEPGGERGGTEEWGDGRGSKCKWEVGDDLADKNAFNLSEMCERHDGNPDKL